MDTADKNIAARVGKIVAPIAAQMGLSIWDIEFVKEGASWYLRIYIDKEGGVTIDDCEALSRAVDAPLDEADPIPQSYYLEVSSPGIERELKKEQHFKAMLGSEIQIKLIRPDKAGRREYQGVLKGYSDGVVTIEADGQSIEIPKADTAFVRLYCGEF